LSYSKYPIKLNFKLLITSNFSIRYPSCRVCANNFLSLAHNL
jgi:hypothetical protein